jgi:hypothetical protein
MSAGPREAIDSIAPHGPALLGDPDPARDRLEPHWEAW